MKVNIIQVSEATFPHRFSWYSNWIDIALYNYGGDGNLLQMRVSRRNAKSFRSVSLAGRFTMKEASIGDIGDLTQMTAQNSTTNQS